MRWLEALVSQAELDLGDRERERLYLRGVSDSQIGKYRLGYIDSQIPDADYPLPFLEWWEDNKWQLDDSFVLPLTNTLGQVLGLQFRHVDQERRGYLDYLASKEEAVLFGLHQAMPSVWETKSIFLVEGGFDLFPVERHLSNVVSTLHAGINATLWRVLRRMVEQIHLGWDADKAGRDASYKIVRDEKAKAFKIKIVKYPRVPLRGKTTKDPSELWLAWGDDRFGVFLKDQFDIFQQEMMKNAR